MVRASGAGTRTEAPSPASRFRRSLLLGGVLFLSFAWGLARPPIEPVAYFGGWRLAKKFCQLRRLESARDVQVLALGTSHLDSGFDSAEFERRTGIVAYNFGVGGMDLFLQSLYLRDVLIPMVEPGTIFWEILDVPYLARAMTRQYRNAPAVRAAALPLGYRLIELESMLPHQLKRRVPDWYGLFHEPPEVVMDELGHTLLRHSLEDGLPDRDRVDESEEDEALSSSEKDAREREVLEVFGQALDAARRRGIRVFVVKTPFHASAFERAIDRRRVSLFMNGGFGTELQRVLAERQVPLVNLRYLDGITDDAALYADPEHLNVKGALALTALLADLQLGKPVPDEWTTMLSAAERRALSAGAPPAPRTGSTRKE